MLYLYILQQISYVDRVVHYMRHVEHAFPTVRGWDSHILRIRQKSEMQYGGFGHGFVGARIDPTMQFKEDPQLKCNMDGNDVVSNEAGEGEDDMGETATYTHKLITTANTIADSMSTLLLLIKEAPEQIRQNQTFKIALDLSRHLVGVTPTSVTGVQCPGDVITQVAMDAQWIRQEWFDCLEKID